METRDSKFPRLEALPNGLIVVEQSGRVVAECRDNLGVEPKEFVAERIVACVNACEGMHQLADGFSFLKDIQETTVTIKALALRRDALIAENNQLRDCLRFAFENLHKWTGTSGPGALDWIEQAGDALGRARVLS